MGLVAARVSTGSELEDASSSLPSSRTVPYGSPEHRAKRSRCELCRGCSNKPQQILHGELSPGIRTTSPEALTAWFADRLPFQFRLPSSDAALQANLTYELAGASLVQYRGIPAAMVVYEAPSGMISLLVESCSQPLRSPLTKGPCTFSQRLWPEQRNCPLASPQCNGRALALM